MCAQVCKITLRILACLLLSGTLKAGNHLTLLSAPLHSKYARMSHLNSPVTSCNNACKIRCIAIRPRCSPQNALATDKKSAKLPVITPLPFMHSKMKAVEQRCGHASFMKEPSATVIREPLLFASSFSQSPSLVTLKLLHSPHYTEDSCLITWKPCPTPWELCPITCVLVTCHLV